MRLAALERHLRTRFGGLYVFGGVLLTLSLALRIALAPKASDLVPDAIGYYQSASYLLRHNLYRAP
jgi:hypothetical protein